MVNAVSLQLAVDVCSAGSRLVGWSILSFFQFVAAAAASLQVDDYKAKSRFGLVSFHEKRNSIKKEG